MKDGVSFKERDGKLATKGKSVAYKLLTENVMEKLITRRGLLRENNLSKVFSQCFQSGKKTRDHVHLLLASYIPYPMLTRNQPETCPQGRKLPNVMHQISHVYNPVGHHRFTHDELFTLPDSVIIFSITFSASNLYYIPNTFPHISLVIVI